MAIAKDLFILYDNDALMPDAWQSLSAKGARVFNPSIQKTADGYCLVYRVVAEGSEVRRLATCRLDKSLNIVPNSIVPLSDLIEFEDSALNARAKTWHADPRYYKLDGRLFIYWNDGANRPKNHQFLLEMAADGCRPLGKARELIKIDGRENTEKNWMLFEAEGKVWAIYDLHPLQILSVDFNKADKILCHTSHLHYWTNPDVWKFGPLRGSTQPIQRVGESRFINIVHSSYPSPSGRKYKASAYIFEDRPPFRITSAPLAPLELPNPLGEYFELPKLNHDVSEVVYPCGAIEDNGSILISYGINDERCAIAEMPLARILETQGDSSLSETTVHGASAPGPVRKLVRRLKHTPLPERHYPTPLFWWDAKGLNYDGNFGGRRFKVGNFGDIASKEIIERITGHPTVNSREGSPKLLALGSIIHTAQNGDIVWGAGAKGNQPNFTHDVSELSVHAVRGPKTIEFLKKNGISTANVKALFDPGCLIPFLYKEEIEAWRKEPCDEEPNDYIIIPHFRDDRTIRQDAPSYHTQIVSVDQSPADIMRAILRAKRVISSSLHGLIFAEALGIPALWLAPRGGEDEMKFYDYYFGTERYDVKRFTSIEDALRAEPMALPTFQFEEYLSTFPKEQVTALGEFGLREGERINFSNLSAATFNALFESKGFSSPAKEGLWAIAKHSCLRSRIAIPTDKALGVRLAIRPFNPRKLSHPQQLEVTLNGCISRKIEWQAAAHEIIELSLPIENTGSRSELELSFSASSAAPRALTGTASSRVPSAFTITRLEILSFGA